MGYFSRQRLAYFDRSIIKRNWKRLNRTPLTRSGLLVRKIARESIRRAGPRKKPNPAGLPPFSRKPGRTPPFKMIYSLPQHFYTSVVIGMVGFGGTNPPPGLQEHGGYARRQVFEKTRRPLKKGGFGGIMYKRVKRTVKVPKHPFMNPALRKAVPRLPLMWKDSLTRPV